MQNVITRGCDAYPGGRLLGLILYVNFGSTRGGARSPPLGYAPEHGPAPTLLSRALKCNQNKSSD